LGESALVELTEFGDERAIVNGDVLFRAGDESYDFFVILEGEVEIVLNGALGRSVRYGAIPPDRSTGDPGEAAERYGSVGGRGSSA